MRGDIQRGSKSDYVFAAVFHGEGHVFVDPPNPTEAQQLKLFTRQEKLSVIFTDATFSFSDGLLEEAEKQVKWMDWFFNQYVYGTERPHCVFRATVTSTPDGKSSVNGTLERSGVPGNWNDVVPVYGHTGDKTFRLGAMAVMQDTEALNVVLPQKVDRLTINDSEDMIADVK